MRFATRRFREVLGEVSPRCESSSKIYRCRYHARSDYKNMGGIDHAAPLAPCPHPAGQGRLPDGRERQDAQLSRARPGLEPRRAALALARAQGRRSPGAAVRELAQILRDLLGRAKERHLLHRDQHLPRPRGDRLHRRRLRREGVRRVRCAKAARREAPAPAAGRDCALHERRGGAGLGFVGCGARRAAGDAHSR